MAGLPGPGACVCGGGTQLTYPGFLPPCSMHVPYPWFRQVPMPLTPRLFLFPEVLGFVFQSQRILGPP
eukprot:6422483-Amphidinium_carterae.1